MKNSYIRILLVLTLIFIWLGTKSTSVLAAGDCNGTSCNGLDPAAKHCPAVTSGAIKILPDGASTAETRVSSSSDCNAKWARVYNKSGVYAWAAADLKCGTNFPSCRFVASPAKIASSSTIGIYTTMQAFASTPTRSCGNVRSDPGPITSISLSTNWCTGTN